MQTGLGATGLAHGKEEWEMRDWKIWPKSQKIEKGWNMLQRIGGVEVLLSCSWTLTMLEFPFFVHLHKHWYLFEVDCQGVDCQVDHFHQRRTRHNSSDFFKSVIFQDTKKKKKHGYDSRFDIVDSLKAVRWLYFENLVTGSYYPRTGTLTWS